MHSARPAPRAGEVFLDARGSGRTLRVSWHEEAGVVVLSLWRSGVCTGTFRLPVDEVPDLVEALRDGLSQAFDAARTAPRPDPLRLASEI
ncbi:MAG TPA: hypothetical protein VFT75_18920 [Nocardioidaceae bacterium]|jgi:hypothetical protein|nr:hypothetical protein [Nocardioidaceae bacterium]